VRCRQPDDRGRNCSVVAHGAVGFGAPCHGLTPDLQATEPLYINHTSYFSKKSIHPALVLQTALSLDARSVMQAMLASPVTMAQRLVSAKQESCDVRLRLKSQTQITHSSAY
jgi:hypothetical protein